MRIIKKYNLIINMVVLSACISCSPSPEENNFLNSEIYETSASGHKFKKVNAQQIEGKSIKINLVPDLKYQSILGFGGSFTEATAYLLNKLSPKNRAKILEAYFGPEGACYSLTRTHINSCDFSLSHYAYAPIPDDKTLEHFSIEEDKTDLIPIIKAAQLKSKEGFKIISSPWTASPWMKDNNSWMGGKLLPKYYDTWALHFSKYIKAYKKEGINIWGITVENEPLGNDNNWESMHFTAQEMNHFVKNHLGPLIRKNYPNLKILGYDQNRGEEMNRWADAMYKENSIAQYYDGMAIHWYASTFDYFPQSLQYAHRLAPNKYLIQTEACVDSEVPKWQDDKWYWTKEATDWGWDWAPKKDKYLHPKYAPVYRYARDIIGCMNNHVEGWIDWNMVLDKQGGPNWFKNWCIAPVIVDPEKDEIYFTPLFYVMEHFSRYIRPGAVRIGFECDDTIIMTTAFQNMDGSIVNIIFNPDNVSKNITLTLENKTKTISIEAQAIQTILIEA